MKTELIDTVRRLFPGNDDGLVVVAGFQEEEIPDHETVKVTTAWTPDNVGSGRCIWTRESGSRQPAGQTRDELVPEPTAHRLDQIVSQLESHGAFHYNNATGWIDGNDWWTWMDPEPDAYPGLHRLVITITEQP